MTGVRDERDGVVRGHFRPEFLNRLDEIVLFQRLKRGDGRDRRYPDAAVDEPA
jgi:ATP-dependent Clp protease ATP-binding subunit ClpA